MANFSISEVQVGSGWLGISPIPGRTGNYLADLATILRWDPALVFTMTTRAELDRVEAGDFATDLAAAGIQWRHLPIKDFGAPEDSTDQLWPEASRTAHDVLADSGKVLVHCFGGCGRSGMAVMRLMVEAGEDADPALERLRDVRPCAVEVEEQRTWAGRPMFERLGWSQ